MRMNRTATALMAGCAAVVISSAPARAAQSHDPQHAAADHAKPASGMAAKDHAMMAEREKMMEQGMMPHMMEHMQEGNDSMAMCPMTKPMGNPKP